MRSLVIVLVLLACSTQARRVSMRDHSHGHPYWSPQIPHKGYVKSNIWSGRAKPDLMRFRGGSVNIYEEGHLKANVPSGIFKPGMMRFRGGAKLTQEQVVNKLNRVPTFAIVDSNDNIVQMRKPDGTLDICWFTDAGEAMQLLNLTMTANPNVEGLHMSVTPLGAAFELCGGWPEAAGKARSKAVSSDKGTLKLRGPRQELDVSESALEEQLQAQGIEPGGWVLPVYFSSDFQSEGVMPLFFSASDFVSAWIRAGNSKEEVPKTLAVMDIRMLVNQMLTTDELDWKIFQFVSSHTAYELAWMVTSSRAAKLAAALEKAKVASVEEDDFDPVI